jgi:hypothetical protein
MGAKLRVGAGFAEKKTRIGWFGFIIGGCRFFSGP